MTAFDMLKLMKLEKTRFDFLKLYYKNERAKMLKEKIFDDMHELSDEIFFKLQKHALKVMQKVPLSFCRIDLFNSSKGILINELTPIPGATKLFYPKYDYLLGKHFHESKKIFRKKFENNQFDNSISILGHSIIYEWQVFILRCWGL